MYGFSSCCLNDSFKATQRESGSLFPYFGCAASHTEFDSVGARNIPERLRLTKAVLQSKDIGCGFAFPCQYGSPSLAPAPGKQPLKKFFQEAIFSQAVKQNSQVARKGSLLHGRGGSQPACVWKPVFGRNGLASTMEEPQICSGG